jgi:pyrroline-5-carboxylate reductase
MAAAIGESITTLSRGSAAGDGHLAVAKEIFSLVGEVVEVDEKLVDAVTAISASGPAYFFYFLEAMMKAARALGLDAGTAERLVFKTARGSMKLIDHLKEDPAVLRAKVASKGGTTEAALKVFESKKFHDVVKSAVTAACRRSKELSKKAGS